MFKGKSIEELDALMVELKQAKQRVLAEQKEEANSAIRASLQNVEEGTPVKVIFKGEEIVATFHKLTDKQLTIIVDDNKRSVQLDKFVAVA